MRRPSARRLPGIRFEVQAPSVPDTLPRMDVAAFVGFAASGPLHLPVVVEDVEHFTALFGGDVPLAVDAQRGETVQAYLAPAVRDFFRNGGRRCWVVRVAGEGARSTLFPVPGLLRCSPTGQLSPAEQLSPAFARARSEGSWSDPLRISTSLFAEALELLAWAAPASKAEARLTVVTSGDLSPGDLLRVRFASEGLTLLLPVEAVAAPSDGQGVPSSGPAERQTRVIASGTRALWLRSVTNPGAGTRVARWTRASTEALLPVRAITGPSGDTSALTLVLEAAFADAPPPGSLLHIEGGAETLWLTVSDLRPLASQGTPVVQVSGEAVTVLPGAPALPAGAVGQCERLTFDLWVRRGAEQPQHLEGLGFCPKHPRFWGALPTDAEWVQFADAEGPSLPTSEPLPYETLRWDALDPRFPLASQQEGDTACYFPLGMALLLPEAWLSCIPSALDPLERDGLDRFDAGLFLDEALRDSGVQTLLSQADFLCYQSPQPRSLKGIHALLSKADVTLVAVPDAIHRPWVRAIPEAAPEPEPPSAAPAPPWGKFLDCGLNVPAPPAPLVVTPLAPVAGEAFTLSWPTLAGPEAIYTLEEATRPGYQDAVPLYRGADGSLTLYGRTPGTYYYRVRVARGGLSSAWSPGLRLTVASGSRWQLVPEELYSASHLRAVQLALLRLCAARGDLLALLSLPEHFREDEALAHVSTLRSPLASEEQGIPPLGFAEENALSYGALYHPWLISPEEDDPQALRRGPPDGSACGVIARRTLERGAWLAPANEPWHAVVALTPPLTRERWLELQDAQVNLILQEPRGFVTLSESTLSVDPELTPIHVRRLLALLRRAALQRGTAYVFEPNDASFRRLVQRGFEDLLGELFARGAFAGPTRESSFQVVTDARLNPPNSVEQGRFIVELKVAPSSPLTFLNVRLVQSGDRGLVTEER